MNRIETATRSWSPIENDANVNPRSEHTAVVFGDSMFVFGGRNGKTVLDEILEFKFETQSWSICQVDGIKPPAR